MASARRTDKAGLLVSGREENHGQMESQSEKTNEQNTAAMAEELRQLLERVRTNLMNDASEKKVSIADFVRLNQMYRELEDLTPGEIRVLWVRNDDTSSET